MTRKGFTLIELLIVVAIIAILAAIAIPNLLEAQTRAKMSRVKADFRSLATALESYYTDHQHYPAAHGIGLEVGTFNFDISLWPLTTPIAYMTNISMRDPFNENTRNSYVASGPNPQHQVRPLWHYFNYEPLQTEPGGFVPGHANYTRRTDWAYHVCLGDNTGRWPHRAFGLWSPGTDKNEDQLYYWEYLLITDPNNRAGAANAIYDPTNGTVSKGDYMRMGGGVQGLKGFRGVDGA